MCCGTCAVSASRIAQAPALASVEKDSETERDVDLALLLELDIPVGEQGRPQSTDGSCCFGQLAVKIIRTANKNYNIIKFDHFKKLSFFSAYLLV